MKEKENLEKNKFNNPAKSSPQVGEKGKRKKNKEKGKFAKGLGIVLMILHLFMSGVFVTTLMSIDLLPMKYLAIVILLLLVIWVITFATQKRHKRRAIPGKIWSLFWIIVLAIGSFYVGKMDDAFDKVTSGTEKVNSIIVVVKNNDAAETIEDAIDYKFGTQFAVGGTDIQEAIDQINAIVGKEIEVSEFENMQGMAEALFNGTVDAMIYNEGYNGLIEELFEGYESKIKVIYRHSKTMQIETVTPEPEPQVSILDETFSVYISGIDVYGPITTNSRSDVNIIATVNPSTRQILLTTTPRDYYVPIPGVSNGQKDKLTHAGIYGVDASMATLSNLYETSIPYYARVNFTSLIEIVDHLGGVDVYSEYSFSNSGVSVQKGMNHLNGKQALAFARERYKLPGGDNQRGKNQQAVIVGIINKLISPAILTKASGIIDSVSGNVQTNMPQDLIQELIKMQLNEGGAWNIYSVAATGTGGKSTTYSMPGFYAYVMHPNMDSVNNIIDLMNRVEDGEKIEGSVIAQ